VQNATRGALAARLRRFTHAMKAAQRKQLETGWRKALDRARRWEAEG